MYARPFHLLPFFCTAVFGYSAVGGGWSAAIAKSHSDAYGQVIQFGSADQEAAATRPQAQSLLTFSDITSATGITFKRGSSFTSVEYLIDVLSSGDVHLGTGKEVDTDEGATYFRSSFT